MGIDTSVFLQQLKSQVWNRDPLMVEQKLQQVSTVEKNLLWKRNDQKNWKANEDKNNWVYSGNIDLYYDNLNSAVYIDVCRLTLRTTTTPIAAYTKQLALH